MTDEKFDKQKHLHAIEAIVTQNLDVGKLLEKRGVTVADMRAVFNLARSSLTASPDPVPMLLWCPECGERHVDRDEFATKPHHTHSCQHCGHTWRPAVVQTVGVQFLPGFRDEPLASPAKPSWTLPVCHYVELPGVLPTRALCGREIKSFDEASPDPTTAAITCVVCQQLLRNRSNHADRVHLANPDGWKNVPLCDRSAVGAMTSYKHRVTCVACMVEWANEGKQPGDLPLPRVQTIHIQCALGQAICGTPLHEPLVDDPMAATCIECKRVHDKPSVHLVLYGKILCGLGLNPLNKSTAWLEETTCVKCKHIYKEEYE